MVLKPFVQGLRNIHTLRRHAGRGVLDTYIPFVDGTNYTLGGQIPESCGRLACWMECVSSVRDRRRLLIASARAHSSGLPQCTSEVGGHSRKAMAPASILRSFIVAPETIMASVEERTLGCTELGAWRFEHGNLAMCLKFPASYGSAAIDHRHLKQRRAHGVPDLPSLPATTADLEDTIDDCMTRLSAKPPNAQHPRRRTLLRAPSKADARCS